MTALTPPAPFLKSRAVKQLLDISAPTLTRWIQKGYIKGYQPTPNSPYRFLESDVLELLNKRKPIQKGI